MNFFALTPAVADDAADRAWLHRLAAFYTELEVEPPATLTVPMPQFDEVKCAIIEELPPAVVSFHFGLPDVSLVSRIRSAGAKIVATATTVDEARWLAANGCDAVIAQGYEAGGHRGTFMAGDPESEIGTLALVPQIVDAIDLPVIAAGGIADGRGIAAAFALGACGVQIGTAYLYTDESIASEPVRAALRSPQAKRTSLTKVLSGRTARAIVNRFVHDAGPFADAAPAFPKGIVALAPLYRKAEAAGSWDFSALFCGQAAALAKETTAARLTRDLPADALRHLGRLAQAT